MANSMMRSVSAQWQGTRSPVRRQGKGDRVGHDHRPFYEDQLRLTVSMSDAELIKALEGVLGKEAAEAIRAALGSKGCRPHGPYPEV